MKYRPTNIQKAFKQQKRNEKSLALTKLWGDRQRKRRRSERLNGKKRAKESDGSRLSFWQTSCRLIVTSQIYERNPTEMEWKKIRHKCRTAAAVDGKEKKRISFATSFTFYLPWTLVVSSPELAKEAKAIVSQWCIRFECASCGMEVTISLGCWIFFFFFFFFYTPCRPSFLPRSISPSMTDSHDIQAFSCRTTFIRNFKCV